MPGFSSSVLKNDWGSKLSEGAVIQFLDRVLA